MELYFTVCRMKSAPQGTAEATSVEVRDNGGPTRKFLSLDERRRVAKEQIVGARRLLHRRLVC